MDKDPWLTARRLRNAGDVPALAEMLMDPGLAGRRQLRRHLLWTLSESDHPAAGAALITALKEDPSGNFRLLASSALARRGGADVEPTLVDALRTADDHRIRMHAARGLASATGHAAAVTLVAALRDQRAGVRCQVAESLGSVGISHPDVIGPLSDVLEDKSLRVRLAASRSLSRLGARSALPAMRRARDRAWPPWRFRLSKDIQNLEEHFT